VHFCLKFIICIIKINLDTAVFLTVFVTQGDHWAWKVMEFRKSIFQAWIVMEKSRIMSWNFYNCTEKFCNECDQWVCRQFSLLQPTGTVTTNSGKQSYVMFRLFREKCRADRSWKWKFILVGLGKSWKMIFLKEWSPWLPSVVLYFAVIFWMVSLLTMWKTCIYACSEQSAYVTDSQSDVHCCSLLVLFDFRNEICLKSNFSVKVLWSVVICCR